MASLAIAVFLAGGAFLLSYLRTPRKIVKEPDSVPGSRGGIWGALHRTRRGLDLVLCR